MCVYNMRLGEKENLEEECCWGLKIAIFQQKKKGCCVFVYLKKTRKIRLFIEGKKKLLQTFWFDKGQLPKASFYFWWGGDTWREGDNANEVDMGVSLVSLPHPADRPHGPRLHRQ